MRLLDVRVALLVAVVTVFVIVIVIFVFVFVFNNSQNIKCIHTYTDIKNIRQLSIQNLVFVFLVDQMQRQDKPQARALSRETRFILTGFQNHPMPSTSSCSSVAAGVARSLSSIAAAAEVLRSREERSGRRRMKL